MSCIKHELYKTCLSMSGIKHDGVLTRQKCAEQWCATFGTRVCRIWYHWILLCWIFMFCEWGESHLITKYIQSCHRTSELVLGFSIKLWAPVRLPSAKMDFAKWHPKQNCSWTFQNLHVSTFFIILDLPIWFHGRRPFSLTAPLTPTPTPRHMRLWRWKMWSLREQGPKKFWVRYWLA